MNRWAHLVPVLLVGAGCSVFSPSVHEGDGVGSNTNWFRSCDSDTECGEELGCICGACTKRCTTDEQCGDEGDGICPVDRGAFQVACEPQVFLSFESAVCARLCNEDGDCSEGQLCVGSACGGVRVDPCEDVVDVRIEASSAELRARVGSLFGDQYYVPQWYPGLPQNWEEPYTPSTLTVRLSDESGEPVAGCEVVFVTEGSSGYAYAQDIVTNERGELSALWVAGSATEQSLRAGVWGGDRGWLFDTISGEARAHDENPQSVGPEARNFTAPSGLVVAPEPSDPTEQMRVLFTPLSFPAGVSYVVLDSEKLQVEYLNDGETDASDAAVPASERLLELRIPDQGGLYGGVVALSAEGFCTSGSEGLLCAFQDAWMPGETIEISVETRLLGFGEIPEDYDPDTHFQGPCEADLGCTDYSVSTKRAGEEPQRQAVLRAAAIDDFSVRGINIAGVYTPDLGVAPSCLETKRAEIVVKHETLQTGGWVPSVAGTSWSFHETWQNQICSNYAAFATSDGYYLSTGGPSSVSTPTMPGDVRDL